MSEYVQLELPLGQEASPWQPQDSERLRQLRVADRRAKLMDLLYEADGRNDPSHPQHGFFTGLGMQYHQAVGQALTEQLLGLEDVDLAQMVPGGAHE